MPNNLPLEASFKYRALTERNRQNSKINYAGKTQKGHQTDRQTDRVCTHKTVAGGHENAVQCGQTLVAWSMDDECRLTRLKVFFIGQILRTLEVDWDCSPLSSDWTEDNSDQFGAGVNKTESDEVTIVLQ